MSGPRELAESLARIAREAGKVLVERFHRPREVAKKGAIDLVTDADRAAEEAILEALGREFPGAAVLAEESGARSGSSGLRFIVDPLDGTTNYAMGMPHYCTTLAAEDGAGLAAGVILDPSRDELYLAFRGGGARCNGSLLRVNRDVPLEAAVLATGFPYDVRTQGPALFARFERVLRKSRAVRRFGSAALDLAWVAHGRYDGYFERGVRPWDVAAGMLLVTEAGGICLDYAGNPVSVEAGEVVAAAAPLAREIAAELT